MRNRKRNGLLALSPLLIMVASFCVLSVFCGGFSKVPILIVFLITSAYALLTLRGMKLDERISIFSRGAADENMLLMVWIFILAGGFAHAAKGMAPSILSSTYASRSFPPTSCSPECSSCDAS